MRPDAVTDQTSAHDPVNGYLPQGWTVEQWIERRVTDPAGTAKARTSMAVHVEAMVAFTDAGVPTFDYGNNIRQMAKEEGVTRAFDFPGFRAGLYPAAFLSRRRAVPLGGALGGSRRHPCDRRMCEAPDA